MGERETEVKKLNGLWGYLKGTPMALSRARAFNVIFGIYFLLHNPSLQSRGVCVFVAGSLYKALQKIIVHFVSLHSRTASSNQTFVRFGVNTVCKTYFPWGHERHRHRFWKLQVFSKISQTIPLIQSKHKHYFKFRYEEHFLFML